MHIKGVTSIKFQYKSDFEKQREIVPQKFKSNRVHGPRLHRDPVQ